jgi:hypothetical protein
MYYVLANGARHHRGRGADARHLPRLAPAGIGEVADHAVVLPDHVRRIEIVSDIIAPIDVAWDADRESSCWTRTWFSGLPRGATDSAGALVASSTRICGTTS